MVDEGIKFPGRETKIAGAFALKTTLFGTSACPSLISSLYYFAEANGASEFAAAILIDINLQVIAHQEKKTQKH